MTPRTIVPVDASPDGSETIRRGSSASGSCHSPGKPTRLQEANAVRVVLAGAPNVGKSALFNRLTASYATVSNYPGTSVELTAGIGTYGEQTLHVLDSPGIYSLLPSTEEERVTQRLLLGGEYDVVVHVADAKNLSRALPLTLQLCELGRPLVLAVNMIDEAERLGVRIDYARLSERLGVPVVPVAAIDGRGVDTLRAAIATARGSSRPPLPVYENGVGEIVEAARRRIGGRYPVDATAVLTLAMQDDAEARALLDGAGDAYAVDVPEGLTQQLGGPPVYRFAYERKRAADALLAGVVDGMRAPSAWTERLGRLLARPLTGFPILLLVLYVGLYKFVGEFGAGTVVDWIEGTVFEEHINPAMEELFAPLANAALRELFVGEFGLLTLGLRYAVAIILPLVGTFFLFFSVLEDSGYFPRLALLVDRGFKRIGLSGRAVIPMVLGFACGTMATMVTRTLETRRERVMATMLLALAVPCSAQLGVIVAILAVSPAALLVWAAVMTGSFLLVGLLGARLLPGDAASFHMELPPLRLPRLSNVAVKTYTRMHWYFREVLPLFLLASALLWAGDQTGALPVVIAGLAPVVALLGLPAEAATVFLFGFFRRDYGAAGLFDLQQTGLLDVTQLTVAAVTLTLFVPCIAQFLMMLRERGAATAFGMLAFITPFAFGVGFLLHLLLRGIGW
jgi:ferrous iron transport protein B